jgi:hypothetical protein
VFSSAPRKLRVKLGLGAVPKGPSIAWYIAFPFFLMWGHFILMFYSWILELMVVFCEKSREISFEHNKIKRCMYSEILWAQLEPEGKERWWHLGCSMSISWAMFFLYAKRDWTCYIPFRPFVKRMFSCTFKQTRGLYDLTWASVIVINAIVMLYVCYKNNRLPH